MARSPTTHYTPGKVMRSFGRVAEWGIPQTRVTRSETFTNGGAVVSTETIIEPGAPALRNRWSSFGEFLNAVTRAADDSAKPDPRLTRMMTRAPSGLNEVDPTAGGFLIPDVYSDQLIASLYEEAVIAPLCDRRTTDHPENASLPAIDETSRADGSRFGGVLSYFEGEGVTPPTTLAKFRAIKF